VPIQELPQCHACGRHPIAHKRVYADGKRYFCVDCNSRVASIEAAFGRSVEVYRLPGPGSDALVRLGLIGRAVEEADAESDVGVWFHAAMTATQIVERLRGGA
jgi:hypothetical protein